MHEEDEEMNLLRQLESSGGAPKELLGKVSTPLPDKSWPVVIYILPSGDVIPRREMTGTGFGSPHLAHRSSVVLRFTPESGNEEAKLEVLKYRMGDIALPTQSLVKAHLLSPESERGLARKMFPEIFGKRED